MATTNLTAICSTPQLALDYYMRDKIEMINSIEDVNESAPHKVYEENGQLYVRYFTLTTFNDCDILYPYSSFEEKQKKWQNVRYQNNGVKSKKGKEPLMYELRQSFDGWEVPFEIANEIGRKLVEELFSDYTVTISTHGNTENVHNHIAISAWNNDGRKLNDCHKLKRDIRAVSDRLCEEYGLNVLEHTRDMKLVRWQDKDGVTHYYEPTDRKNEMIKRRANGELTADDIRSYRNTAQYEIWNENKNNNRDEIKNDIDTLLPSCRSYEELLVRLRDLGYTINARRKNGSWLSHVSYKAPTHLKATREDKIGNGVFYLRENLEKYIAEQVTAREHGEAENGKYGQNDVTYFANYEYGQTDINKINLDYKAVMRNGEIKIEKRSGAEQKVVKDIFENDRQIKDLVDTSGIRRLIAEQKAGKPRGRSAREVKAQNLIRQIQSSFRCLRYSEQHDIYSYDQILELYRVSKSKYLIATDNSIKSEKAINDLKRVLTLPSRAEALRAKIDSRKADVNYRIAEMSDDEKTLREIETSIKKYKIDTAQGLELLRERVNEFETRQRNIKENILGVSLQMQELENCIRTFDRIDSANGNRNVAVMREFEKIHVGVADSENKQKREAEEKNNR